jgi:hypothetical protein
MAIPTYMEYHLQGPHTAGTSFAQLTGAPAHLPDNGWLLLQTLAGARPVGFGRTDCRFVDGDGSGNYRSYSTFNDAAATTIGTTSQSVGSHLIAWLNGVLGV